MSNVVTQGRAASPAAASTILELLPEPVLLVRAEEDEGPEIAYANRAARELYRIDLVGAPLGAALSSRLQGSLIVRLLALALGLVGVRLLARAFL